MSDKGIKVVEKTSELESDEKKQEWISAIQNYLNTRGKSLLQSNKNQMCAKGIANVLRQSEGTKSNKSIGYNVLVGKEFGLGCGYDVNSFLYLEIKTGKGNANAAQRGTEIVVWKAS